MKSFPFHKQMARCVVRGIKDKTRRPIRLVGICESTTDGYDFEFRDCRKLWNSVTKRRLLEKCPYGKAGDSVYLLAQWVTEKKYDHLRPSELPEDAKIWSWFLGDELPGWAGRFRNARFMTMRQREKFMPTAVIKSVGVSRLQTISGDDVLREGVSFNTKMPLCSRISKTSPDWERLQREEFKILWSQIYGEQSWDANPLVWEIEFELCLERNIELHPWSMEKLVTRNLSKKMSLTFNKENEDVMRNQNKHQS